MSEVKVYYAREDHVLDITDIQKQSSVTSRYVLKSDYDKLLTEKNNNYKAYLANIELKRKSFRELKLWRSADQSAIERKDNEIVKLQSQNAQLVEALKFYANSINWTNSTDALMNQKDKIYFDKDNNGLAGRTARETLAKVKGNT